MVNLSQKWLMEEIPRALRLRSAAEPDFSLVIREYSSEKDPAPRSNVVGKPRWPIFEMDSSY